MKGMSFQNGVEFKVVIEGESWSQGDEIRGKIESKPLSPVQVYLAEGNDKKVKAKSADAFIVLQELTSPKAPFDWKFPLNLDARISDKSGSLYLLYGNQENLDKLGQLRLDILPHIHLKDLIDLCTMHFRFALKSIGFAKSGDTEIKLGPPSNKEWTFLEELVIHAKLNESTLQTRFQFHRKEIDGTKGGLVTKSVKREISRKWNVSQIVHDFNQRLNKEIITVEFEKIVAEYREAGWLSS
jgi:hypothetical protein